MAEAAAQPIYELVIPRMQMAVPAHWPLEWAKAGTTSFVPVAGQKIEVVKGDLLRVSAQPETNTPTVVGMLDAMVVEGYSKVAAA